jgi:hypothetical protein
MGLGINQSIEIIEKYISSFDENDFLFNECDVTYYWDLMNGAPEQERLNFLCAEWKPFIAKYNPSAFVRSWGGGLCWLAEWERFQFGWTVWATHCC